MSDSEIGTDWRVAPNSLPTAAAHVVGYPGVGHAETLTDPASASRTALSATIPGCRSQTWRSAHPEGGPGTEVVLEPSGARSTPSP